MARNRLTRALPAVALALVVVLLARPALAQDVRVMTSGGFTAAFLELVPEFERMTGKKVGTTFGASMGNAPDSIPSRLERGEPVDVVILADTALDGLVGQGKVVAGSRVDLVRSNIGIAVKKGAPKPDISTVDALKRALHEARSIAYSASASGVYVSTELYERLGMAAELHAKSTRVVSERVAAVVARGEAELGFQQVSELLPVQGAEFVGTLPDEVQRVTVFSAGIATGATAPDLAKQLVAFLASKAAWPAITRSGLEPAGTH